MCQSLVGWYMYIDVVVLSGCIIVALTFAVVVYIGVYAAKRIREDSQAAILASEDCRKTK